MVEKKTRAKNRALDQRRVANLEVLHQVGLALASIRNPEELVQHAVDTVREAFGYYYAVFLAYDPVDQVLWPAAYSGDHTLPPEHVRLPLDVGLTGLAARQREPIIVNDVSEDLRYVKGGIPGVSSEAAFPIQRGEQLFGVLSVTSQEQHVFDDEATRTLTALANQIAVALENAQLFVESQRRVQELTTLTEISAALNQALTLEETLDRVLQAMEQILGEVDCSILFVDELTDTLRMVATRHLPADMMAMFNQRPVRCAEGTFGIAIQTGEVVEIPEARTDPRVLHDLGSIPNELTNVPLRTADGSVIGVLALGILLRDADTRRLVLALVDLAAIAIQRARQFDEEQRRREEATTLRDVGAAITASLDLPTILQAIYEATVPTLNADTFYVALLEGDEARRMLSFQFVVDAGTVLEPFTYPLEESKGLANWVIRHRQPLLLRDLPKDSPVEPVQVGEAVSSSIIVPIISQDRLIGVIAAQNQRPNMFDERHQWLLSAVADQAAIAIENARLYQAERQRTAQTQALRETAQVITSTLRLEDVLTQILEQLQTVVEYDSAALWLREGPQLRVAAGRGFANLDEILELRVDIADNPLFKALVETRQHLVIPDAQQDERFLALGGTTYVRSWIGVPLVVQDNVIGSLTIDRREPRRYTAEDGQLALAFGSQAAIAIENARLYAQTRRGEAALNRQVQTLTTLLDVSRKLQSLGSLEEKAQLIAQGIVDSGLFGRAVIAVLDKDENTTATGCAGLTPEDEALLRSLPPTQPEQRRRRFRERFRVGHSYYIPHDADRPPDTPGISSQRPAESFVNWHPEDQLFVPMWGTDGRLVGNISVDDPGDGQRPTTESVQPLELFAGLAAMSLESTQLYQEAREAEQHLGRQVNVLTTLLSVANALQAPGDLQPKLDLVAQGVVDAGLWGRAVISVFDDDWRAVARGTAGLTPAEVEALGQGPQPSREERIRFFDERFRISVSYYIPHDADITSTYTVQSQRQMDEFVDWHPHDRLLVPLYGEGARIIGQLSVDDPADGRRPTAESLRPLELFANQAAMVIETNRLFAELQLMNQDLEAMLESQRELLAMVRELSSPVMPIFEGVLVMPLVGPIDSMRAQQITGGLLASVESERARFAIIDITGVPMIDSHVARYLANAMQAARLLGAEPVLVGITPAVAQTMVEIHADLGDVVTRGDLQSGIAYALRQLSQASSHLAEEEA